MKVNGKVLALSIYAIGGVGGTGYEGAALEQARRQERTFRGEVHMATVQVFVTDGAGAPVTGLGVEDFAVEEDGVAREVALVLPAEATALDVGLVLDYSESMGRSMPGAGREVLDFIAALKPVDCVLFVGLRGNVEAPRWYAADSSRLPEEISRGTFEGATFLFDGIVVALDEFIARRFSGGLMAQDARGRVEEGGGSAGCTGRLAELEGGVAEYEGRRRALVVVSDGGDTKSRHRLEDVVERARIAGVPIFGVGVRKGVDVADAGRPPREVTPSGIVEYPVDFDTIRRLSQLTGGDVTSGRRGGLARVLLQLRGGYIVGYHGEGASGGSRGADVVEREVKVGVEEEGLEIVGAGQKYVRVSARRRGESIVSEAAALVRAGDARAARELLDVAIAHSPEDAEAHFQRAIALAQLAELEAAAVAARRATELAPSIGVVHYLAASLALERGDSRGAWTSYVNATITGYSTAELRERLERLGPVPEWVEEELRAARITVRLVTQPRDFLRISEYRRVARTLERNLMEEAGAAVVSSVVRADASIILKPRDTSVENRRLEIEATMRVPGGRGVGEWMVTIDDGSDRGEVESAVSRLVEGIMERVHDEARRRRHQDVVPVSRGSGLRP